VTHAIDAYGEGREQSAKPGLLLTTSWDDGHPLDLRVADLLSKYDLKGTFYIPCESQHDVLSAGQISELATAFEVGAHTVHHVALTSVADAIAREEIVDSKRSIETITGEPCRIFCFPMGRFEKRHLSMLREAGFSAARTVELFSLESPKKMNGVDLIPTTLQAYPHSPMAYWKNCAKRFKVKNFKYLLRFGTIRAWETAAIAILESARERGGVFHLWGHSSEIQESAQWESLERVFSVMKESKRDALCVTNSELCDYVN
jgi:peptidoglycan/xylan/chitin deacetylase (PgdA/CDA1 family)